MLTILTLLPGLCLLPLTSQSEVCHCSGLTDNCTRSDLFWTKEVFRPSQEDPGFSITDRDPSTWLGSNKPWYDAGSGEVRYTFSQGDPTIFYWSLPSVFLGIVQFCLTFSVLRLLRLRILIHKVLLNVWETKLNFSAR